MFSRFRSAGRIRREAADWRVRLDRDSSGELYREFNRWHDSDPRHAEAYARIAAIWSGSAGLTRTGVNPMRPPKPIGIARFALAAGIAALLIATSLFLPGLSGPAQTAILATHLGEARRMSLSDGTVVMLAPDSRATAMFTRSERRITLQQGRARFQVSEEGRPFIVEVNSHEVTGTGSSFEVAAGPLASVTPLEGAVEVRRNGLWGSLFGDARRAEPGQRLVLADDGTRVEQADPPTPVAMIRFDNVKLGDAVRRFNMESGTKLKVAGQASSFRLTGAYRIGDASGFAQSLAVAFSLNVEPQEDGSLLLRARR